MCKHNQPHHTGLDFIFEYLATNTMSFSTVESGLNTLLGVTSTHPVWQKVLNTVMEVEDNNTAGFKAARQTLETMKVAMHTPKCGLYTRSCLSVFPRSRIVTNSSCYGP